MIEIRVYKGKNNREPYTEWVGSIKDPTCKARIQERIRRIEIDDNFGDARSLGDGVYELKFHFGSGYRIYFGHINRQLVILLVGGDKSSQDRDIKQAKAFWRDYKEQANGEI